MTQIGQDRPDTGFATCRLVMIACRNSVVKAAKGNAILRKATLRFASQ
jgi:hypothetical protein